MKYKIDHDYHIHSEISLCSGDKEQTPARILEYAKQYGLKKIVLTDHHWDENVPMTVDNPWYAKQDSAYIAQQLPLPQADGIEFLFGCEIEMDKYFTLGLKKENFDKYAFVIVPTTHMHNTWTVPEEAFNDNAKRMQVWIDRFDAVLNMDLPFHKVGIAHLTCGLLALNKADYVEVLNMIPDSELVRLFTKAQEKGCGIELNSSDMMLKGVEDPETVYRIYRIAKKCGCKFYLGSDSHHPAYFAEAIESFKSAVEALELTEDDKFHF